MSNKLFTDFQATTSGNNTVTEHDGVFFIKEKDIETYLQKFQALQLIFENLEQVDKRICCANGNKIGCFCRHFLSPESNDIDTDKAANFLMQIRERSRGKTTEEMERYIVSTFRGTITGTDS